MKSERIVWIYTCTLILGLAKERNNQSINTRIITDKDKINVSHLYKEKQLRIRKDTININIFL